MSFSIQAQLGNLPIVMECLVPEAHVRFQRMVAFPFFFDIDGEVLGFYDDSGFRLEPPAGPISQEFFYGQWYAYKEIPILLKWLQQFQLQSPFEKEA